MAITPMEAHLLARVQALEILLTQVFAIMQPRRAVLDVLRGTEVRAPDLSNVTALHPDLDEELHLRADALEQ